MKPASTTRSGSSGVDRGGQRGVERLALREGAVLDDRVATAVRRRDRKAGGIGCDCDDVRDRAAQRAGAHRSQRSPRGSSRGPRSAL